MDFKSLPQYPAHKEASFPSQSDRLGSVDYSGRWLGLAFILIPVLTALIILVVWLFSHIGGVNL